MAETLSKDKDPKSASEEQDAPASLFIVKDMVERSRDMKTAFLGADIQIFCERPLPGLNSGVIKAYEARGAGNYTENIFALVCENHLSPRINSIESFRKIINPHLARLVASGVVFWPLEEKRKFVLVYERNLGARVMAEDMRASGGLSHDSIMGTFIKPLVGVLADLRDKEIVHGHVRPANMFYGGGAARDKIILGDCLCSPAWSAMPTLYVPIERAMADPVARGMGTHEEDLYAFGVSLAVLMRESDPLAGMSEEEIIVSKLNKGSYQTITGKDRFTGPILELLRGLLIDDSSQRWTLEEIQAWMDGRRLSPKQAPKKSKASRPLEIAGKKYLYPELLAIAMRKTVTDSAHVIENDELNQWLQRAVENKILTARVEKAIEMAADQGKGGSYQDKVVARVSMALHPDAPIRYKDVTVLPEGMGTALSHAFVTKKDIQPYIDIILNYFVMQWLDMYSGVGIDIGALTARFDSCRAFLRQVGIGFGFERCIYYLDPNAPCLSDKVVDYNVRSPEELMYAYEDLAGTKKQPHYFMDRHIAAFLSVKDRKNIDPYMMELSDDAPYKKILAELKILATIQKRSRMDMFPGIAMWIFANLEPVFERFHDRELRTNIRKHVEKLAKRGDLSKIAAMFDDVTVYNTDSQKFYTAIKEYLSLTREYEELEYNLKSKKKYGQEEGHQGAAILSSILATIVIIGTTFMALSSFFNAG